MVLSLQGQRRDWTKWAMVLYYSGIVAFGGLNLNKDRVSLAGTYVGKNVWVLFCATIIILGSLGLLSRLMNVRRAESICLYSLAVAYAIVATLFVKHMGVETAPDVFIRVITTPLLMAVTAQYIRVRQISPRDVEAAIKRETISPKDND